MKLGLCIFFVALVGMLFGSGTLSRAAAAAANCNDPIAQCYDQEEFLMESEISRRFLADANYIAIAALIKNVAGGNHATPGNSYTKKCVYGNYRPC